MPPSRSPLVVFSHLRWNFVFQRPQHLLSRLAAGRPILYVEEPILDSSVEPQIVASEVLPGLTVCTPHASARAGEDPRELNGLIGPLLKERLAAYDSYDLWFYTPMALPLAAGLNPRAVVYDCMDELSAFKFAPPELLDRERELLVKAHIVFTGGPSLYRSKKDRHPNCHCFPSSVDAVHFGKAAQPNLAQPDHQAGLPHPRLGFFGVIDERFDVPLLTALAEARPTWQFILVGPVVKIVPADLPQGPNIHYFGQQPYEALPAYLNGWDVALLPFARNESTRFISPTKTLEYMAAGKPIVSTSITDVAEPYGHMVGLADTPADFLVACERALRETEGERAFRIKQYQAVLARTSWDSTVAAMEELLEQAAEKRNAQGGPDMLSHSEDAVDPDEEPRQSFGNDSPPVVVIGAGPTGLSAAYHLGEDALLLEAADRVGGWCRSLEENGFTFDYAGHIMFSNDPYVHQMYKELLGDNVHWQDREAWIYSKEVYTRYPFQGSLHGLPADVIKECIVGAIEARFGSFKERPAEEPKTNGHVDRIKLAPLNGKANGHVAQNGNGHHLNGDRHCVSRLLNDKGDEIADCCADGVAESTTPLVQNSNPTGPRNFEEFIYQVWGAGIAKHFAIPYNRKIWAVPLDEMETSWLGGRVPLPDLGEMIEGALSPKPRPMGPNARFGYPLRGGFQALMNGFLPKLRGELRLHSRVQSISALRRVISLTDGTEVPYQQLISTMPLPSLIRAMGSEVPVAVQQAASALRHTSVRCVNLGIGRANLTEKHWIYYPEDTVFHRIFVQGNASPHCNPPEGFGLTCEITYGPLKPLPCDGDDLVRLCIEDCRRVGIIREDDPIWASNQVDMPFAYVVYDHARPRNVALIREWLSRHDIHLAGRYSEWEYYNSDHAFLAGRSAAEQVRKKLSALTVV